MGQLVQPLMHSLNTCVAKQSYVYMHQHSCVSATTPLTALQDNIPDSFSASELSDILAIWRAVSEDYAPFNVDVTTEDPGEAYLAANGMRAAIGGSWKDCEYCRTTWLS